MCNDLVNGRFEEFANSTKVNFPSNKASISVLNTNPVIAAGIIDKTILNENWKDSLFWNWNKPLNISKLIKHINSKIVKVKYTNISKNPLDVNKTHGSNNKVTKLINYKKFTDAKLGIKKLFEWYNDNEIYKL